MRTSGEGVALQLTEPTGALVIRLFCPAGQDRLVVSVPGFSPVGSEERLSVGSGPEVVTLVADARGDEARGGVTGTGAVPNNLYRIVGGPVSANYGSQHSGPHVEPPRAEGMAFAAACNGTELPRREPGAPPLENTSAGACRTQNGKTIPANALRAIGTEPFWAARIDGRCVTYSHPENQEGTRIWTRFTGSRDSGEWTGFYQNQRFVLRTRPQPGCSDGMSDKRYPLAVELTVAGEERRGCAERL